MFFSRKVLKFERCGNGKLLVFSNPGLEAPDEAPHDAHNDVRHDTLQNLNPSLE